jgi:hypothetical protein
MGAALTYALFTLVGIAGEDDPDAPDIGTSAKTDAGEPGGPKETSRRTAPAAVVSEVHHRTPPARVVRVIQSAEQSALERHRLLAELDGVRSANEAADWALKGLPAKNILTPVDAQLIEALFRKKVTSFGDEPSDTAPQAAQVLVEVPPSHPNHGDEKFDSTPSRKTEICSGPCSAARSATSSPSQYAGFITASFTNMAMRPHGGKGSKSIHCPSHIDYGDKPDSMAPPGTPMASLKPPSRPQ